jgi:hypothetical protein
MLLETVEIVDDTPKKVYRLRQAPRMKVKSLRKR